MINYIEGKIIKNSENKVLILNNGIAYEINCNNVKKVNVKLFIVPIFNDGYTFFGFESYKHKEIFEKLIKMGVKTIRITDEMFLLNPKYYLIFDHDAPKHLLNNLPSILIEQTTDYIAFQKLVAFVDVHI